MPRLVTAAILLGSALYALAAVITFTLFYAPFAGLGQIPVALVCSGLVLLPYLLLYVAWRMRGDRTGDLVTVVASVIVAGIGGYLYSGSFGYNDGEYMVAYVLTPVFQAPFALVALGVSYWRARVAPPENAA